MNILFLTISNISTIDRQGIYTDLLREFKSSGHCVYVIFPMRDRQHSRGEYYTDNGVHYVQVKTGNLTKTNLIRKGIATLLLDRSYRKAIVKHLSEVKFDLIIYTTPPVTFERVIELLKTRDQAITYLLLKDIFPQNAVDLNMFTKRSILYRYFRYKEKKLYNQSDFIGCMSPANVEYVLSSNPELSEDVVEVCPNSLEPINIEKNCERTRDVRIEYNIPHNKTIFIYGGNLGKPQGLGFLCECVRSHKNNENIFFVVVGSGTEFRKLKCFFEREKLENIKLLDRLPKDDYQKLVNSCDVGLLFLDQRFTIPNYPSRLLSYMQSSIPVLAATDVNTDVGKIIEEGEFGFWCEHGNLPAFNSCVSKLMDPKLRTKMGANARRYLEANYTARHSYEIIMKHFEK